MHPGRITFRNTSSTGGAQRAIAVLTLALCLGCHGDLTRYYPLDPGFAWQYRVSLTEDHKLTVVRADVVNMQESHLLGRKTVPQRSDMFGQILIRFLVLDGRGVFEYAQQVGDGVPISTEPPNYVLRAPVADGTTWSSSWHTVKEGRRLSVPTVKTIAAGNETVMVPAGTFAGCLRVRITGKVNVNLRSGPSTIDVQGDEWYAPEVGFIKGTFRETVNGGQLGSTELGMLLDSFAKPE
jgi:hypothetical protein